MCVGVICCLVQSYYLQTADILALGRRGPRQQFGIQSTMASVIMPTVRGILRVTAAATGLLLVYGIVFAMEGMTVRVATIPAREVAVTTAFMLPWTLLFCSGFEDFGIAARRDWVFWVGTLLLLSFIYYFERHTTSSTLTKAAMPVLATVGGVLPHVSLRLRFAYTACSLIAGIAGVFAAYHFAGVIFSGGSFATGTIGGLIVGFCIASTATGVLAAWSLQGTLRRYRHT
jgi:hypothetical protein